VPRLSLRGLTLVFLLMLFLATLLTGLGVYSVSAATIRQLVDQRTALVSAAIAPDGGMNEPPALIRSIGELNRQRDTGDLGIVLLDPQGRQIAGNVRLNRGLQPGFSSVDVDDQIKGLTEGRTFVRDLGAGLRLIVVAETEPFDHYGGEMMLADAEPGLKIIVLLPESLSRNSCVI
jgi:hypothetical protein